MKIILLLLSAHVLSGADFVRQLEKGHQQKIVTYGTSLTAGAAWVTQMQSELDRQFPGLPIMANRAQGAMWSGWGVTNLDARVLQENPDVVFIEFAINDAYLDYHTSVEQSRANLENMIDRLLAQNKNCQIILLTMNPPTNNPDRFEPRGPHLDQRPNYQAYYNVYRQVARKRKLTLIDLNKSWEKLLREDQARFDRLVLDGIHPNELGAREIITPEILKVILRGRAPKRVK
jgi:acyl-CoA thioesterase-1